MYLETIQMALAQIQHIFYPASAAPSPKTLPPPLSGPVQEQSPENEKEGEEDGDGYTTVHLPQMFTLFLSGDPPVNPHYAEVRAESERWLARYAPHPKPYLVLWNMIRQLRRYRACKFDDRAARRLVKTDFSYFCSISAPRAGREELRTVCDWGNWVCTFPFMRDLRGRYR
jgi:hypothetical protein